MENTGRTLASVSFVASVAVEDPEDDADEHSAGTTCRPSPPDAIVVGGSGQLRP
jgi:hypothetical protein